MNAILLAAGYGTRLYPLTRDRAKPLLEVGGRPLIDHLIDQLETIPEIERLLLVSNDRFVGDFEAWAADRTIPVPLRILNDGSTCNENRRGAVWDIRFALERADAVGQPAYVLATDNLPRFNLADVVDLHRRRSASAVFACPESPERLKSSGVAELDQEGRIIAFQEKPRSPRGRFRVPPFYVYSAEATGLVDRFLAEGNNPDAPGHLLAWLVERVPVYALRRPEGTYDVGTLESYRAVCREFEERG